MIKIQLENKIVFTYFSRGISITFVAPSAWLNGASHSLANLFLTPKSAILLSWWHCGQRRRISCDVWSFITTVDWSGSRRGSLRVILVEWMSYECLTWKKPSIFPWNYVFANVWITLAAHDTLIDLWCLVIFSNITNGSSRWLKTQSHSVRILWNHLAKAPLDIPAEGTGQ